MLNPSTKLAWEVFDDGAISGSQRCCFFHCRTQCLIDATVHAAYVPSTCTPFYLLTEVLPVLLVGLAWETLHVIPGLSDGGVISILENTEKGSTLVSKGREQSSRAYQSVCFLLQRPKTSDAASDMEPLSSAQVFSGGRVQRTRAWSVSQSAYRCHRKQAPVPLDSIELAPPNNNVIELGPIFGPGV